MEKTSNKKRQAPLDLFFPPTRTRTANDGSTIIEKIITEVTSTEKSGSVKVPCTIRGCGRSFGNKGALATHVLLKHPGKRPADQSSLKFLTGTRKFPLPFWKFCTSFVTVGIFWKSNMDMDFASFSPWCFDEEMKKKRRAPFCKSETRQRFTILKKAQVIEEFLHEKELDTSPLQERFCVTQPFEQSCLLRWVADKDQIFKRAADAQKKKLFRGGPVKDNVGKFPLMESSLFALFKERRSQGRRCSPNWVKKTATKEMQLHYPDLVSQF